MRLPRDLCEEMATDLAKALRESAKTGKIVEQDYISNDESVEATFAVEVRDALEPKRFTAIRVCGVVGDPDITDSGPLLGVVPLAVKPFKAR